MRIFILFFLSYNNSLSGYKGQYSKKLITLVIYFLSLMQIFLQMSNPIYMHNHFADYQLTHHLATHFDKQFEVIR